MPAFASAHYSSTDFDTEGITTQNDDVRLKVLPRLLSFQDGLFRVASTEQGQSLENKDTYFKVTPTEQGFTTVNTDKVLFKVTANIPTITTYFDSLFKITVSPRVPAFTYDDFDECYDIGNTHQKKQDKLVKFLPRFETFTDGYYFKVRPNAMEDDHLIIMTVPEPTGTIVDPILSIMLMLKNNWNLSASGLSASDITFSTGWYDSNIAFPQITVTPSYSVKTILTTGDMPVYQYKDGIHVDIWVRPFQDSGKSLGEAKDKEYKIRREVERILRTGSHIGQCYNNQEFIYVSRTRILDEVGTRPPLLRSSIEVIDNYFRQDYGFNRNYGEV